MSETFGISLVVNASVPYTIVGPSSAMFIIEDDNGKSGLYSGSCLMEGKSPYFEMKGVGGGGENSIKTFSQKQFTLLNTPTPPNYSFLNNGPHIQNLNP